MKFTAIAFCLLFSLNAFAVEQELSLKSRLNGQPSFGIQYAYDVDFVWSFTYATTISNQTLSSLPNIILWNIQDTKTNKTLTKWTEIDKGSLMIGTLRVSDRSTITSLLPVLKTAKVIFRVMTQQESVEKLFSIPFGPLCQKYPTHFVDLTNTSLKGCEVKAQDIPDNQSECNEWENEFLDYVNQGLLTCEIAKKQYAKRGCGILSCH